MERLIELERHKHIGLLSINRPHVRNALSYQTLTEMNVAISELQDDPQIRAVIITGVGEQAFCAGADLKERQGMSLAESLSFVTFIQHTCQRVAFLPMPTIAAINGDAFGGGLELALACDIRLACSKARLGLTECSLGIIPGAGGTQRLPRIVGMAKAMEMVFLAQRLQACEALAFKLLNAVAEENKSVLDLAHQWAEQIAKNAPLAIRAAKKAILEPLRSGMEAGLAIELSEYERILSSKDRLEGIAAFMEKRAPHYQGL